MDPIYSIRLSGAGGHGLIQAARILAEAAAVYGNKNAAESCSYGPEARGNASRGEILISDEAIDCPKIKSVDLLMALTQEAFDKHGKNVKSGGIIVTDETVKINDTYKNQTVYSVPLVDLAESKLRKPAMINIVALGFLAGVCNIIDKKSIQQAILARVPRMLEETYIEAFETGLKTAREIQKNAQK